MEKNDNKEDCFEMKKIGDSMFFLVPYEYRKVYNLEDYKYKFEITKDGTKISYTRISKNEEPQEE